MLDCQTCGACCRAEPGFGGGAYVRLEPGDLERLRPDEVDRFVVRAEDGRLALRLATDAHGHRRCAALEGRLGERARCSIYARRPSACRAFEAGTPECGLAREEAGLALPAARPGR